MPQRKINVVFHVTGYDDGFGINIPVTRITTDQLRRLQESIANAKLPADSCPASLSIKYEDYISFLDGGACRDHMTTRYRTIEISDLFWTRDNDTKPCGKCKNRTDLEQMRHCASSLRAGKCRDEFMQRTIGAILFPKFYAREK